MKRKDIISDSKVKAMQKGATLFIQRWEDLFQKGLQSILSNDSLLDLLAEQQVDCGNGHLARQMRLAKSELSAELRPTWLDRICQSLITARALCSLDSFSEIQQIDILVQAGLRQQKKWLSTHAQQRDTFTVLSCKTEALENLFLRTSYFQRCRDGAYAQEIKYWHLSESPPKGQVTAGQLIDMSYRYYPSALPLRIDIEDIFSIRTKFAKLEGLADWSSWQKHYCIILKKHPWLSRQAFLIEDVQLENYKGKTVVTDHKRESFMEFDSIYSSYVFAAFSAGQPFTLFMLGQGGAWKVLTLFRAGISMPIEKEIILYSPGPDIKSAQKRR